MHSRLSGQMHEARAVVKWVEGLDAAQLQLAGAWCQGRTEAMSVGIRIAIQGLRVERERRKVANLLSRISVQERWERLSSESAPSGIGELQSALSAGLLAALAPLSLGVDVSPFWSQYLSVRALVDGVRGAQCEVATTLAQDGWQGSPGELLDAAQRLG